MHSTAKRDAVEEHIRSYNPTVSHYRREHAPKRLYLPSDLTEKLMHQHFQDTHQLNVTYAFYCKKMREMNISLVKLGKKECEVCVIGAQHRKESGHPDTITGDTCSTCIRNDQHLKVAKTSRDAYRKDGEIVMPDTIVLAVDLQKVMHSTLWKYCSG